MKLKLSILFLFFYSTIFSQITIDNTQSAQDLVQLLFNNSGCATISNFQVSGNNSYASFDRNGSTFAFDDGIVLATGYTSHISGPNSTLSDDNLGTGIDTDMNTFFSDTYDTTVLEFDFVPITNYMSFEYIFASEEYQEGDDSTCNYSDVFAFLIKSSADTNYTNIALVPNTNIPVQVTTVHPDIPGGCQAENEAYFGSWNSQSDPNIPINFNGQTAIMKAESTVVAGLTYHIKLIIADHSNYRYDSAVFLKAGSFNIGTDLGVDFLRATQNPLCDNEIIVLDSGLSTALSYDWFVDMVPYDGVFMPISGANSQTYTVNSEGKYKVAVDLGSGCISEGNITIEYANSPTIFDADLVSCNDDLNTISTFDLSDSIGDITNNNTDLMVEGFYHSFTDATMQNDVISNSNSYINSMQDEAIFARIVNQNGCASIARITLKVFNNPQLKANEEVFYCLNTYPDNITLDSGLIGNPLIANYTWFFDNGIDPAIDLLQNSPTININEAGIYTVEIESTDGCIVSRNIMVINSNIATIVDIVVSESMIINRISIHINVTGEGDYEYAVDDYDFQNSPIIDHLLYGYHVITVRDKNGCLSNVQQEITILQYQKFFTPNNDQSYDTWNLDNSNSLLLHYNTISDITIYNRHGKIMAIINSRREGWNGFYNGVLAFPEDYWFSVDLIDFNGKVTTKRGNFSLVR